MLESKIEESRQILDQAFNKWNSHIVILCDFGIGDTLMLHLVKELYGEVSAPILFIDHDQHFPEVYSFMEELSKLWNLRIISMKPEKAYGELAEDKVKCCYWLKTEPLFRAMKENNWEACCINIFSEKDPQDSKREYITKKEAESFYRIYPLLHWSERDVWRYVRLHGLPYCPIYDKGYKRLACMRCTAPALPVEIKKEKEKADKKEIIKSLRNLGYF